MANIQTVSDLFPSPWLHSEDLGGRVVKVKVAKVDIEDVKEPKGNTRPAAVLTFERATKRLILNKTQARALVNVLGTDRLQEWVGGTVVLFATEAPNGKPTIGIGRPESDSGTSGDSGGV